MPETHVVQVTTGVFCSKTTSIPFFYCLSGRKAASLITISFEFGKLVTPTSLFLAHVKMSSMLGKDISAPLLDIQTRLARSEAFEGCQIPAKMKCNLSRRGHAM